MVGAFFNRERVFIVSDFDGTIGFFNIEPEILKNIDSGWEELSREFFEGKIGSKEAYRRAIALFKIKREFLLNMIDTHFSIDSGFPPFHEKIRERGWKFFVVSDGFRIYIERVLEKYDITPDKVFANEVVFDADGNLVDVVFPHEDPECGRFATCKKKIIEKIKEEAPDSSIFYFGDGKTDFDVADKVDFLFAKGELAIFASEKSIPFVNFKNFTRMLTLLGKIRWIIFDLDGVLINSEEAILEAINSVLKETGRDKVSIEQIRDLIGIPLKDFISHFTGYVNEELISTFRGRFREVYLEKSHLLPGVENTLDYLHMKGYHLGVITNKKGEYARNLLEHLGISRYFDFVTGEEENLPQKPDGELWLHIFNQKGISSDEVIYVGDAEVDADFAKAGGVKFAGVATSRGMKEFLRLDADIVVNSISEMVELF